jgi:hypothetical protein
MLTVAEHIYIKGVTTETNNYNFYCFVALNDHLTYSEIK